MAEAWVGRRVVAGIGLATRQRERAPDADANVATNISVCMFNV